MKNSEKNQYINQVIKEQVVDNPSYADARKKILILLLIPAAFMLIDRIIAIAYGALATSSLFSLLWGLLIMAMVIFAAISGSTVLAAVWLFLNAGLSAITLISQMSRYGIGYASPILLVFYALYIIAFVAVGIILLCERDIKEYHALAVATRKRAKDEAAHM